MEKHIKKVHSPTAAPRKSFTTYHANLASTFPPRVNQPAPGLKPGVPAPGSIHLASRRGRRAGAGRCAECGAQVEFLWHYTESSHGAVDICAGCKPVVFERSFGQLEMDSDQG